MAKSKAVKTFKRNGEDSKSFAVFVGTEVNKAASGREFSNKLYFPKAEAEGKTVFTGTLS